MTDKKKIILIYVGVAVISAMILGLSFFLATLRKEKRQSGPVAVDTGKEQVDEIKVLDEDIELEREDGSTVKISDLNDKVWVAVQFYASCPMCAERNAEHLLQVYHEFQNEPNFRVLCLSVDPGEDTPEKVGQMRDLLEVDQSNWWFLKAEKEKLWNYMRYQMLFGDIRERTEPLEAAAKGKWAHDLGIQVYRGNTMVKKWHTGLDLEVLSDTIRKALSDLEKS